MNKNLLTYLSSLHIINLEKNKRYIYIFGGKGLNKEILGDLKRFNIKKKI